MGISLTIISFSLLISLIFIGVLYNKILSINNENNSKILSINNEIYKLKKYKDNILSISVGDRVLLPDYALIHNKEKVDFKVTYDLNVLDVSNTHLKVSVIDYTSNDSFALDPANKSSIINFMQNKWILRKNVSLIFDKSLKRDLKIDQLLN